MKTEVCLLPVRCHGCECVFDLWQDLQKEQEKTELREYSDFKRLVNQSFCWECRQIISGESSLEEQHEGFEEPRREVELSIAFE